MKKKIITSLVVLQLLIILYLTINLYSKRNNILGMSNVNPIKKDFVVSTQSGSLKYFYEHPPNAVERVDEWKNLFFGTYRTNTDGLREDREYPIIKPDGYYRIMTLGDSFTFGELVEVENSWPEILEKNLNSLNCQLSKGFEIINLGVRGYDIQYSAHRYRTRGQKYDPDLIIWFLKDDDFTTINEIMLKNSQKFEEELRASGEFDKTPAEGDLHPLWARMLKDAEKTLRDMGKEKVSTLQLSYLDQLRHSFKKDLVLLTLPTTLDSNKQLLQDYAKLNKKTYFFAGSGDIYKLNGTFLPVDGHPNPTGHRIIAEDLFNYLTMNKILPCN